MPERRPDGISRLMLFFAIVYTVEGFCQAKVGVVWQPLTHYLKEIQGWDAVQIAASLAVLDVPWIMKPLYGMMSDFLPLFGYRRRSYLLLANIGAIAAFALDRADLAPGAIVSGAAADLDRDGGLPARCAAHCWWRTVRSYRASAAFINQQWLWFNVAVMVATLIGGGLIEWLSPAGRVARRRRDRRGRTDRRVASLALVDESAPASALRRVAAGAARFPRGHSVRAHCGWSLRSCSCIISVPVSARRCIST